MKKNYLVVLLFVFGSILTSFAQICPAPGDFRIFTTTGGQIVADWEPSTFGSDSWLLLIVPAGTTAPTNNPTPPAGTITVPGNSFILDSAVPSTQYDVYVRMLCPGGSSAEWAGPLTYGANSPLYCSAFITRDLGCVDSASVFVSATGGSGNYEYSIDGVTFQSSNTFNVVQSGVYTFAVKDVVSGAMTLSSPLTIASPFPPTVTATVINNNIVATPSGGPAPFRFAIESPITTPFQSSGVFTNVPPGTYTIVVVSQNGCRGTTTVTIHPVIANDDAVTVYPVNGSISTSTYSVLSNDFQGSNLINPSSFVLSSSSVPSGFILNPNGTVSVLSGTPNGVYTFDYMIFATNSPVINDTATVTITVVNEGILMNAFIDSNANGTKEVNEPYFTHGQFGYELNNSGVVNHVTSSNGDYFINESNSANSYDLTYAINPEFASQYNLTTTGYANVGYIPNSGVTLYSFPVTQAPFSDLETAISQNGTPPRPGFTYQNRIMYRNNGNLTVASGTISFTKDANVTITTISEAGAINTTNGFTYDFTNLLSGETRYVIVTMQVPTIPTVNLGQLLTNSVSATVPVNDTNAGNNSATVAQTIVGSYDPNDKTEAHGGKILHADFTSNDYLTYTIQFENTGTYQAENVKVVDVLDAKLDETSVKMVDASHGYMMKRVGNTLNWSFEGIDLPPSVANTRIGHGYITFKIKPKPGYAIGDNIPNTASIYFDFNPAIVTNTYTTEFVSALSTDDFDQSAFTLYPNPTTGMVTIALKDSSNRIDSLNVVDVTGKTVLKKSVNDSVVIADVTSLANGLYFITIRAGQQESTIKVVKQ
ncbi:T9SS type A sorting domain-containing protein [Flavobacterium sp. GCM10027622]|uniref:T9SS type A sorting domain-containing protein n=1 Tax=unclassified Flavobacterium TaxID=196869 RepID=UPI0036112478